MLVVIAIVGVMQGMRALGAADVKAQHADLIQRLAREKLDELRATEDPNALDTKGDFTEQGHPEITWTLDSQPSGATNVNQLQITATEDNYSQTLTVLMYVPPTAGSTGQ